MFEIIAKGGIVMAPLMLCSIISITIIIERAIFWIKQKRGINPTQLLQMAEEGKFDEIIKGGKDSGSSSAWVILSGIMHHNTSPSLAMEAAAMHEIARMKKYLPAMDTIITLALITLVPYNYFLSKTEKASEEMEQYATKMEMVLGEVKREGGVRG